MAAGGCQLRLCCPAEVRHVGLCRRDHVCPSATRAAGVALPRGCSEPAQRRWRHPRVSTFLSGSAAMDFVPDADFWQGHRGGKETFGGRGAPARRGAVPRWRPQRDAGAHLCRVVGAGALTAAAVPNELPAVAPHVIALGDPPWRPTSRAFRRRAAGLCAPTGPHVGGSLRTGTAKCAARGARLAALRRSGCGAVPGPRGWLYGHRHDADQGDPEIAMGKLVDAALLACADMGCTRTTTAHLGTGRKNLIARPPLVRCYFYIPAWRFMTAGRQSLKPAQISVLVFMRTKAINIRNPFLELRHWPVVRTHAFFNIFCSTL